MSPRRCAGGLHRVICFGSNGKSPSGNRSKWYSLEIPLSGNDYHIIGENALGVKQNVISTLERQLGYSLEHDTVTSLKHGQISHRPTRNDDNINIRLLGPQLWHLLRKILKFLRITLLTFYYLGRSSLFFGLLIFEITAFVSIWYIIPLGWFFRFSVPS